MVDSWVKKKYLANTRGNWIKPKFFLVKSGNWISVSYPSKDRTMNRYEVRSGNFHICFYAPSMNEAYEHFLVEWLRYDLDSCWLAVIVKLNHLRPGKARRNFYRDTKSGLQKLTADFEILAVNFHKKNLAETVFGEE